MPQTRPDFMLMLGFYHNFSTTGPKKFSRNIFVMLKTQHIFILEHYLHLHYWTKMSDTFTFNKMEPVPICQKKSGYFYTNFSMADSFPLDCGPTKPGPNPIESFLRGHLKNKFFATPPATIEELKRRIIMQIQNITQKMLQKVFKIFIDLIYKFHDPCK